MAPGLRSARSAIRPVFDTRPVPARIGLVALATDHTSERDFARICDPDETGVYVSRIAFDNPTTPESLRRTGPRLTEAAASILPGEPLDVIAYACTAASVIMGDAEVEARLHQAKPGTACVTPGAAGIAAIRALGARRVSVLTPYTEEVTDELLRYFDECGLDIAGAACLGLEDDREMARVSSSSIIAAGLDACDAAADALFVSCTALRSAACAGELEEKLGKPVITSNQAMIWRCLRLAGISRPVPGYGRVFSI